MSGLKDKVEKKVMSSKKMLNKYGVCGGENIQKVQDTIKKTKSEYR